MSPIIDTCTTTSEIIKHALLTFINNTIYNYSVCGKEVDFLKERIACFTGHRKIPPEELPVVSKRLRDVLVDCINQGYLYFGAGGALGFDTFAAQTVLELKKEYPNIKLILVLPCLEQTNGWSVKDIQEYERLKNEADKVVYVLDHYFRGCMQKRNRHLVDNSGLCICYMTECKGGTAYTVDYALKKGLKVVNLTQKHSSHI